MPAPTGNSPSRSYGQTERSDSKTASSSGVPSAARTHVGYYLWKVMLGMSKCICWLSSCSGSGAGELVIQLILWCWPFCIIQQGSDELLRCGWRIRGLRYVKGERGESFQSWVGIVDRNFHFPWGTIASELKQGNMESECGKGYQE